MLATVVLLLLHVPPVVASVSVVVVPEQMVKVPEIGLGRGFTVTTEVVLQPNVVNVIDEVPPVPKPLTVPVPVTVATPVLLLVQVPPPEASLSVVVAPSQTVSVPVIATGCELTLISITAVQPAGNV